MKTHILLFLAFCLSAFAYYPNFDHNPLLDKKTKKEIAPYLLPLDHPSKPILDELFSTARVVDSEESILAAGFSIIAAMPRSFIYVVKHPSLPGYILKIHLDSEKKGRYGTPGWKWLSARCKNARAIKQLIEKHKMNYFTVPDKWLYPLPIHFICGINNPQPIVLVATEMELTGDEATGIAWKTLITPRHLDELCLILKAGYGSNQLISNIPYTKNGLFAFVDTEKHPGKLKSAKRYFSKRMEKYWLSIIP